MMYNYSKLRGRIIEIYGSLGAFAEALGVSRQTVSNLITGKRQFTANTIESWIEKLDIPATEIGIYFFVQKVDKQQQIPAGGETGRRF